MVDNLALINSLSQEMWQGDVKKYTNNELGFSFEYPATWSDVEFHINREACPENALAPDTEYSGLIETGDGSDIVFAATIAACAPRGGSILDDLWRQQNDNLSISNPEFEQIDLGNSKAVRLWRAANFHWVTDGDLRYAMAASAPLMDKQFTGIGFSGPVVSSEEISQDSIKGFLHIVRSFKLLNP